MAGSRASKRRLLCEGWIDRDGDPSGSGLVFYPERGFVVQPVQPTYESNSTTLQRVWFASGKPLTLEHLQESLGQHTEIVESYDALELEERKLSDGTVAKVPKGGRWFVEGPFQRSDVRNANKRVYPRGIWEKLIADDRSYVQETVKARGMVGHLEHPSDGRTDGAKGAIVITKLKLQEDGVVWGQCELLDTPHGLILQEYTKKGVRWGVSSRGNGTVKDDGMVDESSFVLETWDAVMKPSVPGAYPVLQQDANEAVSVTNGTADSNPVHVEESALTEAGQQYAAQVQALSEADIDAMSGAERAKLTGDLIQAMNRGSTLVSSGDLPARQAVDLQAWLTRKLQGLSEAETLSLDEAIDRAIDEAAGDGVEPDAGYTRVIESLRQRLSDSIEEAAGLRERLEATESRSSVLHEQCDELTEQLSTVEEQLDATRAQLELAGDLLATRPLAEANGLVTAAVEETVRQVPALESFRDVLLGARTVDGVKELAERLLPTVVRTRPVVESRATEAPVAAVTARTSLPTGVVNSDDAGALQPPKPDSRDLSEGVRLASAAVARMRG